MPQRNILDREYVTLTELVGEIGVTSSQVLRAIQEQCLVLAAKEDLETDPKFTTLSVANAFWTECARYKSALRNQVAAQEAAERIRSQDRWINLAVSATSGIAAGAIVEGAKAALDGAQSRKTKPRPPVGDYRARYKLERPIDLYGLLSERVGDASSPSHFDWLRFHGHLRQFYVGGSSRFFVQVARSRSQLIPYLAESLAEIRTTNGWESSLEAESYFGSSYWASSPISFFDAAAILISCEKLAHKILCGDSKHHKHADIEASPCRKICEYLTIIPACWGVDGFTEELLAELRPHSGLLDLRRSARQVKDDVFLDVARGLTVTKRTAFMIRRATAGLSGADPFGRAVVRLKRARASENERVNGL